MKFECQMCEDSCCKKKIVALTKRDIQRLSEITNIFECIDFVPFSYNPKGKLVKGNDYEGVLILKHLNQQCIFLKDNKCSVHKYRPTACRMYPCNPIFIEYEDGFTEQIIWDNSCPGVGRGKEFDIKNLALEWRKDRLEYNEIVDKWNQREDRHLVKFLEELINGSNSNY